MKRYLGPFVSKTKKTILSPAQPLTAVNRILQGSPSAATYYTAGFVPAAEKVLHTQVTPKFWKRKAEGYIIQCPYSCVTSRYIAVPGSYQETQSTVSNAGVPTSSYNQYTNLCAVFQGSQPLVSITGNPSERSRAYDEALTRAFSKANSPDADLLIDLSQIKGTFDMFISAGKILLALATNRKNFAKVGKAILYGQDRDVTILPSGRTVRVSTLDGLWCEARFGWGPLWGTIEGVLEALSRTDLDINKRVTYRTSEEAIFEDTKTSEYLLNWTFGPLVFSNVPVVRRLDTVRIESVFRAGILLEKSVSLREAVGLDASQIGIAAWDLVPWSFIVDRFLNIGNYIRSLTPISALSFGGAWVTERFSTVFRHEVEYIALSRSGTDANGESFHYSRTAGRSSAMIEISGTKRFIHETPPSAPVLRHDWSSILSLLNTIDGLMLAIQQLYKPRR